MFKNNNLLNQFFSWMTIPCIVNISVCTLCILEKKSELYDNKKGNLICVKSIYNNFFSERSLLNSFMVSICLMCNTILFNVSLVTEGNLWSLSRGKVLFSDFQQVETKL